MFDISYNEFINRSMFVGYSIRFAPGLRVCDFSKSRVVINVDACSAYVYCK